MHITLEKWNEIGSGLADNEVINIEQLCYPGQWRVSFRV